MEETVRHGGMSRSTVRPGEQMFNPGEGGGGIKQAGLAGWQNPLLEEGNMTKAGSLVLMR